MSLFAARCSILPAGFYTSLGSEICQSWPQKTNISTAAGCIHKTQPRRWQQSGGDISPIYYPSWPKLFLSFTPRVRLRFQLLKTLCWPSRASAQMKKDVDVRRFRCVQSIWFFIGCARPSEEQPRLHPCSGAESCRDAGGSERAPAPFIRSDPRRSFPFL